jgi:hypothetical protein
MALCIPAYAKCTTPRAHFPPTNRQSAKFFSIAAGRQRQHRSIMQPPQPVPYSLVNSESVQGGLLRVATHSSGSVGGVSVLFRATSSLRLGWGYVYGRCNAAAADYTSVLGLGVVLLGLSCEFQYCWKGI